jgi:hypothetical protein
MPETPCTQDGKPGFKWGPNGNKCFTYNPGDPKSKAMAQVMCRKQGVAIEKSKGNW